MLDLYADDWKAFDGGYELPYDASVPLRALLREDQPSEEVWDELWENLYHQGDIGTASYASLPWLVSIYCEKQWVDHHLPNFVYAVENARQSGANPEVPHWLNDEYEQAIERAAAYCLENRKSHPDRNFRKAVIMLVAIMMDEIPIANLIDAVELGEEKTAIEAYYYSVETAFE